MTGARDIELDDVNRLGRYRPGNTRPIEVKFKKFEDKEKVRKSCYNLRGESIGVSQQYHREVAEKRKQLGVHMRKARQDGKRAEIRYDKLYIDGQLFQGVGPN